MFAHVYTIRTDGFFCLSSGAYGAKKAAGGKVPYGMYTCIPTLQQFALVISYIVISENMKNVDNDR